jgi:hypothetical protein
VPVRKSQRRGAGDELARPARVGSGGGLVPVGLAGGAEWFDDEIGDGLIELENELSDGLSELDEDGDEAESGDNEASIEPPSRVPWEPQVWLDLFLECTPRDSGLGEG